jgi:CrcB protein
MGQTDAARWRGRLGTAAERRALVVSMVAVAVGAALGANLRYLVGRWAAERFGAGFPYGTLLINVTGSLAIGLLLGLAAGRAPLGTTARLLLVTGVLGGYTTFSSFSFEALELLLAGRYLPAAAYLLGSVGGGLLACAAGVAATRAGG